VRAVILRRYSLFTAIPYLRLNGKPLILLDIPAREFTLFGKTFLPTDTMLLMLLLVGIFILIFLLTALFGRVWCGWACPQTVYMEFIYRHDCNEVPVDHPLVQTLQTACANSGREPEIAAMPASCDAWFYSNLIGVPTVVMGAGSLGVAHSSGEQIPDS